MRIVDVVEITKPIASPIRNAYIDFSKMTASLVAVVTDVMRDGRRVVGYGFNSNGRYGQGGLIRERFRNRIIEADPNSLLDDEGTNLDPHRIWAAMMSNEKPGGHGERSVAVGTLDMAVWDAVAKIAGKPLFRHLAEKKGREANPESSFMRRAATNTGQGDSAIKAEMRGDLNAATTWSRRRSAKRDRRRPWTDRGRVGGRLRLASAACCSMQMDASDLETGIAYAKMLREYPLFWYEEIGDPLDYALQAAMSEFYPGPMATGENLFSHQDARNLLRYGGMRPDRDWLQFDCALVVRACRISSDARCSGAAWLVAVPLHPPWRAPDVAEHRGWPRPGRQ